MQKEKKKVKKRKAERGGESKIALKRTGNVQKHRTRLKIGVSSILKMGKEKKGKKRV